MKQKTQRSHKRPVKPLLGEFRTARLWMKAVASIVSFAFLALTLQPLAIAANLPEKPKAKPRIESNEEKLSKTLENIETKLERWEKKLSKREDARKEKDEVKILKRDLDLLDQKALEDFEAIEKHLKDKKLPEIILNRHREAVQQYQTEMAAFKANLREAELETDDQKRELKVKKAKEHLKTKHRKRGHTPTDPNNLPFHVPDAKKTRKPAEKKEDFRKLGLLNEERIQVATATLLPGMLAPVALLAAPNLADLAPTEDVQITSEIQALATQLQNSPVKIYNWVHNNIDFVPTYGSIQGSQMCLQTRHCNAFDTASLLIALLRASGIHARYVYGTVQIPIEKVMNWVGGVTSPEAALQLLGQGGIPNTGLVQGGKITHIKLEHVWVEAWVDFTPSRGAVHKKGDTWVPIDAAFKQYRFIPGMDIKTDVPFDGQAFFKHIVDSAQHDPQGHWVTNIDRNYIETTLTNYNDEIRAYVESKKPDASKGDIVGRRVVLTKNSTVLATGLPYFPISTAARYADLPSPFRHAFEYRLYANQLARTIDSPDIIFSSALPLLIGKKLGLAYVPATIADTQVIQSYIDAATPSIPGYLVQLKAQFRLDGQVVAEGGLFTMGQQLSSTAVLIKPNASPKYVDKELVAGEVFVIGLDVGVNVAVELDAATKRMQVVADAATQQPDLTIDTEQVVGDQLYATILTYFAMVDGLSNIISRSVGTLAYRLPSYGEFGPTFRVSYFFGVPRDVIPAGFTTDIRHSEFALASKNGDVDLQRKITSAIGVVTSAMEGQIPETIYSDPQLPTQGVSAVSLLMQASDQGMHIFRVDQSNIDVVLPQLTVSPLVKSDISEAVAAGLEATVHQDNITVGSWTGAGYIVLDPVTGSGAYRISGGANGGWFDFLKESTGWLLNVWKYVAQAKSPDFKPFFRSLGRFFPAATLAFDMLDLLAKCDNTAYVLAAGVIAGMVQVIFNFFLPFAVGALVASPIIALLYLVMINVLVSAIINLLFRLFQFESVGCQRRQ